MAQQQLMTACVMLTLLLIPPFVFDYVARHFEVIFCVFSWPQSCSFAVTTGHETGVRDPELRLDALLQLPSDQRVRDGGFQRGQLLAADSQHVGFAAGGWYGVFLATFYVRLNCVGDSENKMQ